MQNRDLRNKNPCTKFPIKLSNSAPNEMRSSQNLSESFLKTKTHTNT